jgi:hypothetical protein
MVTLTPVQGDPFAAPPPASPGGPKLTPVEGNPFAPTKTPPVYAGRGLVSDWLAQTIADPLVNALSYPIRARVADIAGTLPFMGGDAPIDQASRDKWQAVRDQVISATQLPENHAGQIASFIASLPGQGMADVGRRISEKMIGKTATDAISPYAQMAMDILPSKAGSVTAGRGALPLPAERVPTAQARAAHAAGYSLAPEQVSQQPSMWSKVFSTISGKDKKFQLLSEDNQRNTNDLATDDLGLPRGTFLNDAAFQGVRAREGQIYNELDRAAPQVAIGSDPEYRDAIREVGIRSKALEKYFPESAANPPIENLRDELSNPPFVPIQVARDQIAKLRSDASGNLRSTGGKIPDAQQQRLGLAQRQAALALENAIERSIGAGPAKISAMNELWAAEQDVAQARAVLNGEKGVVQPPGGMPAAMARLDQAKRTLVQASIRDPVREAFAADLLDRYRAARQMMARSFDIELATNKASGNVIARRISNLRTGPLKRPLQAGMEKIADAYDNYTKAMKDPALAGGVEDWSILDLGAGVTSMLAGHPLGALAILGRPFGRRHIIAPGFQEGMFNPSRPLSTPLSGYAIGTVLDPQSPQPQPTPNSGMSYSWPNQ